MRVREVEALEEKVSYEAISLGGSCLFLIIRRTGIRAVYLLQQIGHWSNVERDVIDVLVAKFYYHGHNAQEPTSRHDGAMKGVTFLQL